MKYSILALGDCNTSGDVHFKNDSYPERLAKKLGTDVKNCGYTMSTTREMLYFFNKYHHDDLDIILIQYGLVDSWRTFKFAPYVLYYPDNLFRKIARKFVKKYKKTARKLKLNRILGEKPVVPPREYKKNIEHIIKKSKNKKIFLIDTVPNRETFRNPNIKMYNKILDDLCKKYENCYKVDLYKEFEENFGKYYLDDTHINDIGYNIIVKKILEVYNNC